MWHLRLSGSALSAFRARSTSSSSSSSSLLSPLQSNRFVEPDKHCDSGSHLGGAPVPGVVTDEFRSYVLEIFLEDRSSIHSARKLSHSAREGAFRSSLAAPMHLPTGFRTLQEGDRIVAVEGIPVTSLSPKQIELLLDNVAVYRTTVAISLTSKDVHLQGFESAISIAGGSAAPTSRGIGGLGSEKPRLGGFRDIQAPPAHIHRLAPVQEGLHFLELAVRESAEVGDIEDLDALFAPHEEPEILALAEVLCNIYESVTDEACVALRQNSIALSLLSPRCKSHVVAVASMVRGEMERRAIPLVSPDHCHSFRELFPEDAEVYGIGNAREEGHKLAKMPKVEKLQLYLTSFSADERVGLEFFVASLARILEAFPEGDDRKSFIA